MPQISYDKEDVRLVPLRDSTLGEIEPGEKFQVKGNRKGFCMENGGVSVFVRIEPRVVYAVQLSAGPGKVPILCSDSSVLGGHSKARSIGDLPVVVVGLESSDQA